MNAPDRLFVPVGDGGFLSLIPHFVGLGPALLAALGEKVEAHRFGDTMADPDDEAFWSITRGSEIASQLGCDLDLVRLTVGAVEVSAEELEALARVCNAARLSIGDQYDPAWQLLTAVCVEATEALLDA